jgi:hypothetical protein
LKSEENYFYSICYWELQVELGNGLKPEPEKAGFKAPGANGLELGTTPGFRRPAFTGLGNANEAGFAAT